VFYIIGSLIFWLLPHIHLSHVIKSKNDNSPKLICFSGGLSVDSTKRADSLDSYQPAATKKVNFLSQNQLKKTAYQ